jgi:hypothetical protein
MGKILSLLSLFVRLCDQLDRWLCCSLPGPIRFQWAKLWVRKDEFHPSLNIHTNYVYRLNKERRDSYWNNLMRRRKIAHERDLATS